MTNGSTSRIINKRQQPGPSGIDFQAELRQSNDTVELLVERLAELELALEDQGWQRMIQGGEQEFSRGGLKQICALARVMVLKNPLIKRGVAVQAHYVFGQNVTMQATHTDINAVLQAFIDDPKNQAELTNIQALIQKDIELAADGNLFFVFFVNKVSGRVRMRSIPFDQIDDVICNPEDAKEPWYYRRTWTEQQLDMQTGQQKTRTRTAYYPDLRYRPRQQPKRIGKHEIRWDAPVFHVKGAVGFSDWKFGLSEVYAAIDWARAYKSFLEDWATITRSYAKFAWKVTTDNGKKGVAQAKARMATTMSPATGGREGNPMPPAGAAAIMDKSNMMEPMKTAGATTKMEDGRRLLLMVAAALGLPETFFGDVSVGTLATAKSLDRPTELAMRMRQMLWVSILMTVLQVVLLWAVKAPKGALRGLGRITIDEDGQESIVWGDDVDSHVDVDFPPIVQIDTREQIEAIEKIAARVPDTRLIASLMLHALGLDDIDEILDRLFDEDGQLKPAYQPQPTTPPTPETDPDPEIETEKQ